MLMRWSILSRSSYARRNRRDGLGGDGARADDSRGNRATWRGRTKSVIVGRLTDDADGSHASFDQGSKPFAGLLELPGMVVVVTQDGKITASSRMRLRRRSGETASDHRSPVLDCVGDQDIHRDTDHADGRRGDRQT